MQTGKPKLSGRTLLTLFMTCFVISACTFGGGMVIISMLQKKFVEELHWIEEDEAMDMVAIAQACPGVMAVNTSIIIGYHVGGYPGALLTVLGTIAPPMIILTVISAFYVQFRSNPIVALVLRGMQAGVVAVMANVTLKMIHNVVKDKSALSLALLALAIIATAVFGVDIILVLLVCGVIGGLTVLHKGRSALS